MRIRRWEEEADYDYYLRDRDREGHAAAQTAYFGQLPVCLVAKARSAWKHAASCGTLFFAPDHTNRELHAL